MDSTARQRVAAKDGGATYRTTEVLAAKARNSPCAVQEMMTLPETDHLPLALSRSLYSSRLSMDIKWAASLMGFIPTSLMAESGTLTSGS